MDNPKRNPITRLELNIKNKHGSAVITFRSDSLLGENIELEISGEDVIWANELFAEVEFSQGRISDLVTGTRKKPRKLPAPLDTVTQSDL